MRRGAAGLLAICVFLEVAALVLAFDHYRSKGFMVRWAIGGPENREVLVTTFEPRVWFRNELRPIERLVQHWPQDRPILEGLPPIDADVETVVKVPPGDPRVISVDASGGTSLTIDGELATGPVSPGSHRLRVRWGSATQAPGRDNWDRSPDVHFRLMWSYEGGDAVPIPAAALTPPEPVPHRGLVWGLGLFLALLLGVGTYVSIRSEGAARTRRSFALAAIVLVLVGGGLRFYEYSTAPDFRENMDELFAAWNGWQLVEDGRTRGWTLWPHYYGGDVVRRPVTYWRERPINTITPYFEHPPLLHLLVGVAAHAGGAEGFDHAKITHTRLVPIVLSLIALVLCMLLALRITRSHLAALLAGLLYAVTPFIALQGRAVKEDSVVAVLLPAMILAFLRYRDRGFRRRDLILAASLAGMGMLAKLPAVALLAALLALVASTRRWKDLAIATAVGAGVSSLLFVYAAVMDWNAFWYAQSVQGTIRQVSPDVFATWFSWPQINGSKVGRGPLIFLWIASAATVFRLPQHRVMPVALPLVTYVVAAALPSGTWHYGWYLLPLYPLLCVLAGDFLVRVFRRPDLLGALLVVGLLTLYATMLIVEPEWVARREHWPAMRQITWTIALVLLLPVALSMVVKKRWARRFARASVALALLLYAGASAHFVVRYDVTERLYYDYDYGAPGVPIEGGRRDPNSEFFHRSLPPPTPEPPRVEGSQ
ncbi:MAG: glycosyltransferase family 39 protein [Myxococcota bacterium]